MDKKLLDIVDSFHVAILLESHDTLLPDFLDLFGVETTMAIIDQFSGTTVKIPKKSKILESIRDADAYQRLKEGEKTHKVFAYHGYPDLRKFCNRMSQIASILGDTVAFRSKRKPGSRSASSEDS